MSPSISEVRTSYPAARIASIHAPSIARASGVELVHDDADELARAAGELLDRMTRLAAAAPPAPA